MATTIFSNPWTKKIDLKIYDKIKLLGRGSFGETYLYKKDDDMVAVKELKNNTNSKETIDNEIRVLKKLGRSCLDYNLLCFKQVELYPNSTLIITEFINGEELFYVFEDMRNLSLADYCIKTGEFYTQLAKAVKYIHSKNVAHYDIKPENIMIEKSTGKLKLIDFGLSKTGYPTIELSGYTKEYAPLYYLKDRTKDWHFKVAKTVDAYCLVSTFYKPYDQYRPLGVISSIIIYYWNYMTPEQQSYFSVIRLVITEFDDIFANDYATPMSEASYKYLLNLKPNFFNIVEGGINGSVISLILHMANSKKKKNTLVVRNF